MYNELTENGKAIPDGRKSFIHSPTGLDIGAETSEEIALSIIQK